MRISKKYGVLLGLVAVSVFAIYKLFDWGTPPVRLFAEDTIAVSGSAGGDIGVLIDGSFRKDAQSSPVFKNDEAFVSASSPFPVGHIELASGKDGTGEPYTNEVITFAEKRPMVVSDKPSNPKAKQLWSTAFDDLEVKLASAPFDVPITVWVLYDKDKDKAITKETIAVSDAVAKTNSIWDEQRMGMKLKLVKADIKNALPQVDPDASKYADFSCGGPSLVDKQKKVKSLKADIGATPGRINVYYVNRVDVGGKLSVIHGQSCWLGSDVVILGSGTGPYLLIHELGHNLNLYHPPSTWMKDATDSKKNKFSLKNVMVQYSLSRAFFTEGQVFRAQVQQASAVNDVYKQRQALGPSKGYPLRNSCSYTHSDYLCPRMDKRTWANGPFHLAN